MLKPETPLPWPEVVFGSLHWCIVNQTKNAVAEFAFQADADYARHAANVMPRLVDVLPDLIEQCRIQRTACIVGGMEWDEKKLDGIIERADAALAAARGGEPMTVTLEYKYWPFSKAISVAQCECRLTPTLIVVESGTVTSGANTLGGLPYRYKRKTGVPYPWHGRAGWRLADGEAERLEGETA